ncbi:dual OB domain-containing protein [Streptomyces specialis]|uniref:dual OB domain-containing protein n=1 Tax=Streptomyces specialis TaxID=498367 RepID=UPI00099F0E06|nr:hypothetical protein [Streptomyces specialis]
MTAIKELVCLANSRKHGERCIAGIEVGSRDWIRPVTIHAGHAISASERRYLSGEEPQVLDVISMRLIDYQPVGFQRENWLLDSSVRWEKTGQIGWGGLSRLEQRPVRLWLNGYSTNAGCNDFLPADRQSTVNDSLKLIRVNGATIRVDTPSPRSEDARLVVRAEFKYAGSGYVLRVTDPVCEEKFRKQGVGRHRLGDSFLTISLSEEFMGRIFKLVAAVIEYGQIGRG